MIQVSLGLVQTSAVGFTREPMELGTGVYTAHEAARLVGLRPERVRRWTAGYSYKAAGEIRASSPIFKRDLPAIEGRVALSFHDLVEVLFVRQFLATGVSMPTIRQAAIDAADMLKTAHPFSMREFATDGQEIFRRYTDDAGVERMLTMGRSKQTVFVEVIARLLRELEYSLEPLQAVRWWPLGRDRSVIVDPRRNLGEPTVVDCGVPTRILYGAHVAGETVEGIADWYEVPIEGVRDAIAFEQGRKRQRTARAA
jgi:uncharacterized protein (DUF433 family)